jgi:hypothetical protein
MPERVARAGTATSPPSSAGFAFLDSLPSHYGVRNTAGQKLQRQDRVTSAGFRLAN